MAINLLERKSVFIRQVHELGEWIGFETRNKYQIQDDKGMELGFAAEQQKGFLGLLLRQVLGHWRTFDIYIFDQSRQNVLIAHHPFRFIFQRLEIRTKEGTAVGAIQQRFSILNKRFDVENAKGQILLEVASPIWKIWTFQFTKKERQVAQVSKKWSGLLAEALTDKDNFLVEFSDQNLTAEERYLILSAALFIDLQYFERKARN
ncbi:MAG: phospholipid scramblase-related protein [Bdellovibrionota bacterium]